MVWDFILPILQELVTDPIKNYVISPIKRHVSYAFKSDSKVQGLQEQVEQLQNKKDRLQQSVDDATRNGDHIFPNVTKWLTTAEKDIGEADTIIQGKTEAKNKCFFGFCPNLKTRYQLGKYAEKKASVIGRLRNQEGLDSISFQPPLQQIVEPSVYSREALPSRVLMLNQVMDALKDPNLYMIGVYGMGGVGKTTLAKEVHAKALQEKLFENVVMVAVSQAPELRRIQGEIADFLGVKFSAEEIPGRASQLHKRLENSEVLIILDDLWQKLDLNAVGIPSHGTSKGRCKIMLTSRNGDLLLNDMRALKVFSVEALKEEETLSLFEMSVAEAKDPEFHSIATQIAKKCAGLPLLIQIVAAELTNKESYEWNNKLNQLSAFGDEETYEKVYKVLESSYEKLPTMEMKSFFLLCALFGQSNIRIQDLLTHSMGLGLFKRIRTVEAARDNVFSMINKLKAKSLLLEGDMVGFVKMHDVIRDTALSIASRDQRSFIGAGEVRSGDWPNEDCTRISLPFCNVSELPIGLEYPEAELFLLFTEDLSLKIPDSFFDGMKKLKVVDFRGMRLVPFPSSINSLTNLQTLYLHKCGLDNVAVLGKLKQLELLSFAESKIVELPREIEALTQLKLLDLRDCSNLQAIPAGVLSKLCSLEELYVLNSFVRWDSPGNASLVELESLSHLLTLEIEIANPKMIPIGFKCFSRLRRYKISVGHVWDWNGQYERSKALKLKVETDADLEDGTELLLRETEDLYLHGARGVASIFSERFPRLKHLHLENDFDIQHLIKSTMGTSFPLLESMHLKTLQSMETICSGQLGMGSFGELQILKIFDCNQMKSLFSFSSAKCLHKLREMEVESCENLEAVVGEGSEDEHRNSEVIELTQLSSLRLSNLPRLIGFCKIKDGTEQMGLLFNTMISFPNLSSLEVDGCKSLKYIFTASMVKCLMRLKKIQIERCESVEEIIESKKMEEEEEEDSRRAIVFPELDSVSFVGLPTLKWFSTWYPIEFPLLRELSIRFCNAMGHFVGRDSSSESEEEECLFNEMVTFSNLETLKIGAMNSIKYLWDEQFIADDSFFKLKFISVIYCSKLLVVFPSKICRRFKRVETLSLYNCGRVEEIYQTNDFKETENAFSLRKLGIHNLPSLKHIWRQGPHTLEFPKLTSLNIRNCSKICVPKFIPNLEEMAIDGQAFHAIHQSSDFSSELCTKLKKVTLNSFSEETSIAIVFGFLSQIKTLEMLVFDECSLEETFSQRPIGDGQHHCLRVKHIELRWIGELKHVINKDTQLLQHLQTLELHGCGDLMSIAPSSICLQNLTTLHLNFCDNVTNLVTTSTAKTMVQLMEMKVEGCRSIEEIVVNDADDTEHDEIIFNKLQVLELNWLPNFSRFSSNRYSFSFPLLQKVTIKQCSRMNIFCGGVISTPKLRGILFEDEQQWEGNLNDTISSQLRNWVGEHLEEGRHFHILESLELVNNTFSSKAISTNQMHFLNKLRNIKVRDCDAIKVVFDLEGDVGFLLPKLNELELINLPMLKQLCNKAPKGILDFYNLKVLKLEKCDRLVYAFTWSMASCLSQLETVIVENCEMMETLIVDEDDIAAQAIIFDKLRNVVLKNNPKFSSIYSGRGDMECPSLYEITIMKCPIIKTFISTHIHSTHRVFPKLQELSTDVKSIRAMMQFEATTNLFSNLKTLEVSHCLASATSCAYFARFLSRLPNLHKLKLCDASFKELFNSNSEELPTMPPIKYLALKNVDDLSKICWHASLFQSLETLKLYGCNQLMNMMTLSMARNMSQLKKLKVSNCKMLMEIVGDGIDQTTDEEIVFTNLKTLVLDGLQSLQAFSLTHYNFRFPCLENVTLSQCPNLRIFCLGIMNAPMLNCVIDAEYDGNYYWEGDLNASTKHLYHKMVGFENHKEIKVSSFPVLKEKWESQFPVSFLYSLERLEVDNCELFSNAMPSHVLQHLKRLKVLIVEKCDSVDHVTDLEGLNANECAINLIENLEELQLIDLPRLKQVWSKDPQQILSFTNLQILKVHNCGSLTFIFNLSMALTLQNLQHVEVKNCSLVEHIITIPKEEKMQKYQTIFPSLQSMTLLHLTHLLSFCSASEVLKCSSLKMVEVVDCPKVDLFDSSIIVEDLDSETGFLGNKMVIPGLEELKFEWKTLKDGLIGNNQNGLFSKLKCIEFAGFQGEEYAFLPPTFLHQFLNLEKLALSDAFIEEINLEDLSILENKDPESIALLTKLKLIKLPNLKHLVRHDCLSIPLFMNLTDLEVVKCDGLINLISASVAKSLVQLRRMNVKDCKKMREIVANASDGEEYEIQFSQLQYLELDGLQCITCFSSGNHNFHFPSLQEVKISGSPNMKIFAERVSVAPNLRKIKTGRHDYDWEWEWEGSLNDTIQAMYMEKDEEEKVDQNTSQKLIE